MEEAPRARVSERGTVGTKGRRTIVTPRHVTLRHARKKKLPSEWFESGRRSDDADDGEWHLDRNHDVCSDATDAAASKRERFHRVGAVVSIETAARGEIRTRDGTSSLKLGLANAYYLRCQRTTHRTTRGCISCPFHLTKTLSSATHEDGRALMLMMACSNERRRRFRTS